MTMIMYCVIQVPGCMLYAIVVCSVFLLLRHASSTKLRPLLEILCLALLKHLRTCVAAEEGGERGGRERGEREGGTRNYIFG